MAKNARTSKLFWLLCKGINKRKGFLIMDKYTVSDLFFNSKQADEINFDTGHLRSEVIKASKEFLEMYPALTSVFSIIGLADDYLKRL